MQHRQWPESASQTGPQRARGAPNKSITHHRRQRRRREFWPSPCCPWRRAPPPAEATCSTMVDQTVGERDMITPSLEGHVKQKTRANYRRYEGKRRQGVIWRIGAKTPCVNWVSFGARTSHWFRCLWQLSKEQVSGTETENERREMACVICRLWEGYDLSRILFDVRRALREGW
ncbi:hypothetical protein N657DRAFT_56813 [Parathielavia appendiculata]|uniref:Uncharacterized protein n=1 Tax=Parathielavia appendiculata TaxID=2587402 RepID=A0AAN6Z9E3_9PEZI|nr:hypothetical protein N657DRAFT_56813 [Parathielavia appendiculata]